MQIKNISVVNFKNYENVNVSFHNKINCFVGNNGVGKTNLLDAIYYLCMCKSYFQSSDQLSIRQGQEFMVLQSNFDKDNNTTEIYCGLKNGKRKIFRKNKKEYSKLAEHIGQYPVVMISPSDSALITDGSEERRKYLNAIISQVDYSYLECTIAYNKVLLQRNKYLKELSFGNRGDLLDVYNEQLIPLGNKIFEARKKIVEHLIHMLKEKYEFISGGGENIDLVYKSDLNTADYAELMKANLSRDIKVQHTTIGPHKDDLELLMNGMSIKKIGSQGQQKSFLVALKLAQFSFFKEQKGTNPLLLLDDIFDKFDVNRVRQIINLVTSETFGQIFITHTNEDRMRELLSEFPESHYLFKVDGNEVVKL